MVERRKNTGRRIQPKTYDGLAQLVIWQKKVGLNDKVSSL